MANLVEQITNAIEAKIVTLVTNSVKLSHTIEIDKNNFQRNKNRHGVRPLSAANPININGCVVLEQPFQVILTEGYINRGGNDSKQETARDLLYNRIDTVMKDLLQSKIGLSFVVNVGFISLNSPEYLEEDSIAILRGDFTLLYAQALT
jgi:hypothetical protein